MAREKLLIKALVPASLYDALVLECDLCGCSMSAVTGMAIAAEIHKRRAERRGQAKQLQGQLDVARKA